jgi:flagellar biosynthetic protein FliR
LNAAGPFDISVLSFALILARVSALVATFPLFAGRGVPRLVKIGLTMSLTWLWLGVYGSQPSDGIRQVAGSVHGLGLAIAVGREVVLGAVLGFGFGLFLAPLRMAGAYIAQEMGLTLASIADPSQGDPSNILAQFFEALGVLLFFALDLHHALLMTAHVSLQRWPCGSPLPPFSAMAVVGGVDDVQQWGLLLAAPVGICLFVTSIVLVFLAKSAPQLNLFSVGLTVRLAVGLLVCLVFLPDMWFMIQQLLGKATGFVQLLLE